MITVLNRSTGEVAVFEGEAWLKSTRACPAPCCDGSCEICGPDGDCPHSEHGADGSCLVRREGEGFRCEAFFPAGVEFSDCSCAGVEACEHSAELRARALALAQQAGRPAGLQRGRFVAARTPAAKEEPEPPENPSP